MTVYPINKHLSDYDMISPEFPFYVSLNEVQNRFPAHRHDFLECSLVIDGEGYEIINGERHSMKRGTLTWLLPYQIHEIAAVSSVPLRLYNCMFELNVLSFSSAQEAGHLQFLHMQHPQSFVQLTESGMQIMEPLFANLLNEYEHNRPFRKELLLIKMHELLVLFQREHHFPSNSQTTIRTERKSIAWPIIAYIHGNYREELSLDSLSLIFHMHPTKISAEIKKHTGTTFLRLLHEIRLRHACSLLVSTSLSILEIAVEAGFHSYKMFARVFREAKRVTPSEYRRHFIELQQPANNRLLQSKETSLQNIKSSGFQT